jgi:hypothetical protein
VSVILEYLFIFRRNKEAESCAICNWNLQSQGIGILGRKGRKGFRPLCTHSFIPLIEESAGNASFYHQLILIINGNIKELRTWEKYRKL